MLQENQGGGGEPLPEVAREGLTRLVLWMHHVKNLNKRKSIVGWAGELHVRGFSKPGFPGIVICEGRDSDVKVCPYCTASGGAWRSCCNHSLSENSDSVAGGR